MKKYLLILGVMVSNIGFSQIDSEKRDTDLVARIDSTVCCIYVSQISKKFHSFDTTYWLNGKEKIACIDSILIVDAKIFYSQEYEIAKTKYYILSDKGKFLRIVHLKEKYQETLKYIGPTFKCYDLKYRKRHPLLEKFLPPIFMNESKLATDYIDRDTSNVKRKN